MGNIVFKDIKIYHLQIIIGSMTWVLLLFLDMKTSVYSSHLASKSVGKMKEQKKMKSVSKGLKEYKVSQAKAYQGREERVHSPHCS